METTPSTREMRECKPTHVALDLKGKLGRFLSISSHQNPTAFGLLKCSVGVPPASVNRSMAGETPDPHQRLRKSTAFELLVLRTHGLAMSCQLVSNSTKNGFVSDSKDLFSEWKCPVRSKKN